LGKEDTEGGMTAYRFYYYDTKERTRVITAQSYWHAVWEFGKGTTARAWRVTKINKEETNEA